jgi:hypothetical protein
MAWLRQQLDEEVEIIGKTTSASPCAGHPMKPAAEHAARAPLP